MAFGVFLALVLFAIPLGLIYNFVCYKRSGILPLIILFIVTMLLGYVATLLYYRISLRNDPSGKIDKISWPTARNILGVTFASYMVLALTLVALAVAPNLVKIFENTLGYWFIGLWGLRDLCNEIFSSPTLDTYKDTSDSKYFNYGFLITRMDKDNIDKIIDYGRQNSGANSKSKGVEISETLPLDFDIVLSDQTIIQKLKNLVYMKYAFGHFTWIYLTSIVSLLLSMISVTMITGP